MNIVQIVATGAVALMCSPVFAEDAPATPPQDASQQAAALAVGGAESTVSQMGAPMGKTRQQVYRELVQGQTNGEAARLKALYRGN